MSEIDVGWKRSVRRPDGVGSGSGFIGLTGVRQVEKLFEHLIERDRLGEGDRLEIEAGPCGTVALPL
jgi:hypothetical protein